MSTASELPNWLTDALEHHPRVADPAFREDNPTELLPGDVVVIDSYDDRNAKRHLLVVTDAQDGWCEGMLAITETELATEVDAVLSPDTTGLGYNIAVLTRFRSPMWAVQVSYRVGAIQTLVLEELENLSWSDEPSEVNLNLGQPLQAAGIDPRYQALRALSAEFDAFTTHYRRRCHDLEPPILDPMVGEADILKQLLSESGWEKQISSIRPSSELIHQLIDLHPQLSRDQQLAIKPFMELSLKYSGSEQVGTSQNIEIVGHKDTVRLSNAIEQDTEILPSIIIYTHPMCWDGDISPENRISIDNKKSLISFKPISNPHFEKAA